MFDVQLPQIVLELFTGGVYVTRSVLIMINHYSLLRRTLDWIKIDYYPSIRLSERFVW